MADKGRTDKGGFTEGLDDMLNTMDANLNAKLDASFLRAQGKLAKNKNLEAAGERAYNNATHVGEELHKRRQHGRTVEDPHAVHKDSSLKEADLRGAHTTRFAVDKIVDKDSDRGPSRGA